MDIQPTSVDAKDILILNPGQYGGEVTIQVVGYQSATAPIRIPLDVLKAFADKVNLIDPLAGNGYQPLPLPEPVQITTDAVS